ncbi:hypothetical protein DFH09DRAFT_1089034 [Mycena vulgaris]|nr:hypothetical protein DFH09DRAFT_1089034 [Mycena vulgaris]
MRDGENGDGDGDGNHSGSAGMRVGSRASRRRRRYARKHDSREVPDARPDADTVAGRERPRESRDDGRKEEKKIRDKGERTHAAGSLTSTGALTPKNVHGSGLRGRWAGCKAADGLPGRWFNPGCHGRRAEGFHAERVVVERGNAMLQLRAVHIQAWRDGSASLLDEFRVRKDVKLRAQLNFIAK